jgi:hypothetical protein
MKIGDEVCVHGFIDEIRKDTIIIHNEGGYFGTIPEEVVKAASAQPEGYVKIPETGIDDLSDGFHTFRQLYYQRMMLFATIVKQNREKAWKSLRHENGELCFGGDWFIVGIDTPEGTYTYHYETNYYSMFDCKELERAKHWDGHTEKDVIRLLSLPSAQQWIPCSERLPKYDEIVLVWYCGETRIGYLTNISETAFSENDVWVLHGSFPFKHDEKKVVAWMPLPEPYEREEK